MAGPGMSAHDRGDQPRNYIWPKWWGLGMLLGRGYAEPGDIYNDPGYQSTYYAGKGWWPWATWQDGG